MPATPEPGGTGRGRLIALEGIDGCGKSTQARLLGAAGAMQVTSEPGATPVGAALRRVLLDPSLPSPAPRAEALLMAADRAEHVHRVLVPALAEGRWVVTDRFSASTLAYQGYGAGLDVAELDRLVRWAAEGLLPDLVVFIDLPVGTARARLAHRAAGQAADRIEARGRDFQRAVRHGFLALAAADPDRWATIDGRASPAAVATAVRAAVTERLGPPPAGWR